MSYSSNAAVTPNPSLEPTHYGRQCKAGLRYSVPLSQSSLTLPASAGVSARTLGPAELRPAVSVAPLLPGHAKFPAPASPARTLASAQPEPQRTSCGQAERRRRHRRREGNIKAKRRRVQVRAQFVASISPRLSPSTNVVTKERIESEAARTAGA